MKILQVKKMKIGLLACLLMLFGSFHGFGQESGGMIKGKVVDAKSGEPLISLSVMIKENVSGTMKTIGGGMTNLDGNYRITDIKPGVYTIEFNYIGYEKVVVENVEILPGDVKKYDIALNEEKLNLEDEIVVRAKKVSATGAALLKDRQKAEALSDAIGAEDISRGGSSDAADAVKKVTGATTQGGKYVFIRGLGNRYSSTQLNGANLPSADPDKKAVHLDLFPSNLIENIVTTKTATPDKPGDFTGGTVNIATKSFPDKFNLNFSLSSAYNSQTTGSTILTHGSSNLSWLGMDDGSRDIPTIFNNNEVPSITEARRKYDKDGNYNQSALLLDEMSKAFDSEMSATKTTAPIDQSLSLSVGNQHQLFGNSFGYLASLSYGRHYSSYEQGIIGNYSQPGGESQELVSEYVADVQEGTDEVVYGGMINLAYYLTQNNKISFNYMYNNSGETKTVYQDGYRSYYQETMETRILSFIQRSISSYQLSGSHNMPSVLNSKFDWQLSLSNNTQDQPDFRTFDNIYKDSEVDGVTERTYYLNESDNNALPSRYFRELTEDLGAVSFDYEIPFKDIFDISGKFKTGLMYNNKERDFSERRFVYQQDGDDVDYDGNPDNFISELSGIVDSSGNFIYYGNYIEDRTQLAGSYSGTQEIFAYYGKFDFNAMDNLRIIGGVRYETTDLQTISRDTSRPEGFISEQDLLPSVNMVYQFNENINLRAAYGKTIARPTFREIAPYDSYLPIKHKTFLGNADLERSVIDNFDLRWEWFINPGEIIAVSGFYKNFKNPIELAIVNSNNNIQARNVDEAILYGAEFEVRKNLGFLSEAIRNFEFGANLTLVHSQVDLSDFEYETRKAYDPDASKTRELQGQSPYVVNLDLTYVNSDWGTEANLHYNIFGKRLTEVGYGSPDYYEFPKAEMNLVISQQLFDKFKLKISGKNLLNSKNYKATTYLGEDYISEQYLLGRRFSVSISYSI